jgi:hypothetical protein
MVMTNIEIDRKLAEAMGYEVMNDNPIVLVRYEKGCNWQAWQPHGYMKDAWEVAEHFGFRYLRKNTLNGKYYAYLRFANEKADTAPMAICLAALQMIEGSKSDE